MMVKTKLSPAQRRFLSRLAAAGERCPFTGNRLAGSTASAWHRTAQSLRKLGLVRMVREGDTWRAFLDRGVKTP